MSSRVRRVWQRLGGGAAVSAAAVCAADVGAVGPERLTSVRLRRRSCDPRSGAAEDPEPARLLLLFVGPDRRARVLSERDGGQPDETLGGDRPWGPAHDRDTFVDGLQIEERVVWQLGGDRRR